MFLRTTLNAFFKSRQKTLLKRRTVNLKNRPLSKKYLKQQRQHINVAFEAKKLSIRKQLDRVKSPNTHLNEIIQDLFYPQLSLNNPQDVDERVRQVSSDALRQQMEWQELTQMDSLTMEIIQNSLPLELLEVHEQKADMFKAEHYQVLMEKINYYCFHKEKIKKRREDNWEKLIKKMRSKDPKAQAMKCPYLFLQKDQIPRHQNWLNFVQNLSLAIEGQQNITGVNQFIPVLFLIHKTFQHIPAELYQLVMNRNASAAFEDLTPDHVSDLLTLLKYRNKLKFNPNIKIEVSEQNNPKEYNHVYLARKLAASVINNPEQYTAEDLSNIFRIINNRRRKMNLLSQDQYKKIEEIIVPILSELSFESVQTFFVIYCMFNKRPNPEFIDIIKYDLYRKADHVNNYFYALDLITKIKQRQLTFRTFAAKGVEAVPLHIEAYDLLTKLSEVVTTMIDKLKSTELIQLLDAYYENDIRNRTVIEILSTQIVKKGGEFELQILAKAMFKLTLLGHSSKILGKYLFIQFTKRYHKEMKKYKEEGVFLLPTEEKVQAMRMNYKQIYLQQCLLMMLWSLTRQLQERLQKQINLNELLDLIPVKIESGDPLAMELSLNVNHVLKEYGLFPVMKFEKNNMENFPTGRLNEFYFKNYHKNGIETLMEEQAKQSKALLGNYNAKDDKFLAERWSTLKTYRQDQYIEFSLKHIQEEAGNCFFNAEKILSQEFVDRRTRVINSLEQEEQKDQKPDEKRQAKKKDVKLYDLLL